jgi:hypothetical protein
LDVYNDANEAVLGGIQDEDAMAAYIYSDRTAGGAAEVQSH